MIFRNPFTSSVFGVFFHIPIFHSEILRHGKHAQQTPSNQPQAAQQPVSGNRGSKASSTQAVQPQQAQAYYNNDMPSQALAAGAANGAIGQRSRDRADLL